MALVVDSVCKRFGRVQALDGISFSVEPGQVFGFLGANGAGKTTTMRIVLDILRPDGGRVTWLGRPNSGLPRATWGYLPEERGLYPRMRVEEQLLFLARLYGVEAAVARRRIGEWLERFQVPEVRERRVEELSKGNQQKIQFLAAILHDPAVLLMDEPFSGLDPVNASLLKAAFLELRDRGKTLVFSTHQLDTVEEICDAVAIIDAGRLVVQGPTDEVRRSAGRWVVRIQVAGDSSLPWLADLDGIRVVRPGRDYTELEVDRRCDPSSILHTALDRGDSISRFEIADPTLEQIFVERVGRVRLSKETLSRSTPFAQEPVDAARALAEA